MLPRAGCSLLAVRAFILAPAVCTVGAPLDLVPSVPACGTVSSHCRPRRSGPRGPIAHFSTTNTRPSPVPYALTAAARSFEEQVQRKELDFLPQAYEHLRQVVFEAQRRGLSSATADASILSEGIVERAMSLLATSPQREHAVLHLAIFNDLLSVLQIHAEVLHPLEFTAQMFQEHVHTGTLDALPHIYDHLQHLAGVVNDPRKIFARDSAAWRAISWMQRLTGGQKTNLVPRILQDLPRLFGLQPTLMHHQLVIKGFLDREIPDEAWIWLRKMEKHEGADRFTVWLKPSTVQYNLLLKYFAKHGDVVSVRMLLAQMPAHAPPSQLSYHYLLAAILAEPAPAPNQRVIVEAAVEELKLKGHDVHLKTLGGVMGRGSLDSWIPRDVLDVLKAAQRNARAKGPRSIIHDPGEEGPDGMESGKMQGGKSVGAELLFHEVSSAPSNLAAADIDAAQKSYDTPQYATPLTAVSEGMEAAQVSTHPPSPENGKSHAFVGASPSLDAATDESHAVDAGADGGIEHHEIPAESTSLHTDEEIVSWGQHGQKITHLAQDLPAIPTNPPEQSELQHGDSGEPEVGHRAHVEQQIHDVSSGSAASTSKSTSQPDSQPEHPLTSKSEVSGESFQTRDPPVSSEEPVTPKPITNGTNDRIRRKHIRLFYKVLRQGDLRDASKIYAELTAVKGPDVEFGTAMIKALCQGHLLKPPPRPHIMQALRIYRSLVEVEERVAIQGFFDSENPGNARIGTNVYNDLLRALAAPAPVHASSRDYGREIYEEYATLATGLLDDMEGRSLRPDDKMLVSILLLRFRAAKTHQEAFQHYKSVADRTDSAAPHKVTNGQVPESRPILGLAEYRSILNAFSRISFPDAPIAPAHFWFSIADDMRARGYAVTVEDYTRFLARISDFQSTPPSGHKSSVDTSLLDGGEEQMMSMYACVKHVHKRLVLDAHISPDAYLLNTLMNVYQHLGCFEDALRVFNTIWLSGRMDNVTPIIIFDACGHAGRQSVAYTIWCMLVAEGWKFDKRTLDTWVECLCRSNVEAACRFVCVYMGRENAGYLSEGDTRPDVQTCLILLKLSWLRGQNAEVKEKIRAHLPHIWDKLPTNYQ